MSDKKSDSLVMVDEAYKSDPLNFAVYGKHCFKAVKGDVANSEAVSSIRLSRGGWTPVASIGEARMAYAKFIDLRDMDGISPKEEPGGLGLVANAKGEIAYMVYGAGVAAVTYLGTCGSAVTDKAATTDMFSIRADEVDEGARYYPVESDEWAIGYQGEFRGMAPAGRTNFGG